MSYMTKITAVLECSQKQQAQAWADKLFGEGNCKIVGRGPDNRRSWDVYGEIIDDFVSNQEAVYKTMCRFSKVGSQWIVNAVTEDDWFEVLISGTLYDGDPHLLIQCHYQVYKNAEQDNSGKPD